MKKYFSLLLLLTFAQILFSQDSEQVDDELDEIIEYLMDLNEDDLVNAISDLNKYHFIMISTEFNNKTYFLGRDLGIDQYNINTQLMYENHIGIFLGVSGTYYSKFDPSWDITIVTGGYGLDFGKADNFRAEIGYSRYFFSDSNSNDFENSIDLGLDFSTKNNTFGSTINSSYLFGEKTGYQASLSLYSNLNLFYLNQEKGSKINFEPNISFVFGSENIDTSRIDNLGIDLPFINNIVDSFQTFSLRNVQLRLPITLELNQLNIEAGLNINFPKAFDFENNVEISTFYNLGLIYIFDINN